jgi:hypothetical protein
MTNKKREKNKMPNPENLKPFSKDYQPEKNGRPKGSKNRSTIARKWLEAAESIKNPITGESEYLSQEDIMTLALIKKARNGDVQAYQKLMDSGYGMPTQQIDVTAERPIFNALDLDVPKDNGTK